MLQDDDSIASQNSKFTVTGREMLAHAANIYQTIYEPTNLTKCHKACTEWAVGDYARAAVYQYGYCFPINDSRAISAEYICCMADQYNRYYIHQNDCLHIMRQWGLYSHNNFWKFIQTFNTYEKDFSAVYQELFNNSAVRKKVPVQALNKMMVEYNRIVHKQLEQLRQQEQQQIQAISNQELSLCCAEIPIYSELEEIYETYGYGDCNRISKRRAILHTMQHYPVCYTIQSYPMDDSVREFLNNNEVNIASYAICYGNQLQQLIHQECIDILRHSAVLRPQSRIQDYKYALLECTDAAREYNHAGYTHKAMVITDMCWALLDYGSAVLEGTIVGATNAIIDMVTHPIEAVLCAAAGEYMLAYQCSKVVVDIAQIGIVAATDWDKGLQQWHEYIEPINNIINAINEKQLSVRDGIKGATQLVVQWKTQNKLLGGLNKLYTTIREKALFFAEKYPLVSPEQYIATSDGLLLKASCINNFSIENSTTVPLPSYQKQSKKTIIKNITNFLEKFESVQINVGNKVILLDKKGMKHILTRHHPKFWDGSIKSIQSFFDKKMNITEIVSIIKDVLNQNRDMVKNLSRQQYQVKGIVKGKTYIVGIRNEKVGQFYNIG